MSTGDRHMNSDFARCLSLLRQEKGVSQRMAARDLGISQALLSHYENGIREPGLAFVIRACDYYSVSADFLLGRTLIRDGSPILGEELPNADLEGGGMASVEKKLLSRANLVLFDLLGRLGSQKAIKAASNYLSVAIYTMFRYLYRADPDGNEDFFSIPEHDFVAQLPQVDMILSTNDYVGELDLQARNHAQFPDMSNDALADEYPGVYQSLLQIIHATGERVNREREAR